MMGIQAKPAAESIEGLHKTAASIREAASNLDSASTSGAGAAHHGTIPVKLREAAEALGEATNLATARQALKQLSEPMAMWAEMSHPKGIDVLFCPMAKASWLQRHGDVRNPYLGKDMLGCGRPAGQAGNVMEKMENKRQPGH